MIRRIAFVSGLVILNAFGFATVARAGEGGVAGSAAFTVGANSLVTGVAVSAAVGKENAAAHSFNYSGLNTNGLQNSAFAIGTAGTLSLNALGDPAGFNLNTVQDSARGTAQVNTFTAGYTINLGTTSNAVLGTTKP
ncbi:MULTISPECIES: hypothetical protein [Microcoleaceae]|uniref:hypothetical protein n=1 Tax=Microcoleaceae TaxID=1892252 RepID=UPI0018823752|nr:hypothetical protein [Tychonema sp. LEGE 06208]MBE9164687.1 hypothetical protein [Tychonema sp. LEGE 06208]